MWKPENLNADLPISRAIVECLAQDITKGHLKDGAKLPTVRALADTLGINVGTAFRAYNLAEQQGLLIKEVGRGSFVRSRIGTTPPVTLSNDNQGIVDLARNEPPFLPLDGLLRQSLKEIARDSTLDGMMEYGHSQGLPRHRDTLAGWLAGSQGFSPNPENIIITGGAQQGLTITLGAMTNPGDTLLVEEMSYPGVRNLAGFFGLTLKPVAMDSEGILPEALDQACLASGGKVLYCMPYAHNPTTATMSAARRAAILEIVEHHGLRVIEDDVNTHTENDRFQPLAAQAPERVIYISSLSKIVAPGLRVGMIVAPTAIFASVLAASQTTSWMAPPLMAELACLWIQKGTVKDLVARRSTVTQNLLAIAQTVMKDIPIRIHEANTHVWLPLPLSTAWSSREFEERAASKGVRVSSSYEFATDPGSQNSGIRICLRELPEGELESALQIIVQLYQEAPKPKSFIM